MKPVRAVAYAAVAVCATGLLAKRDRDQQRRLDDLSGRVAELSEAARRLTPPLRALPVLLAERRCTLDPQDLDRILRGAVGKSDHQPVATSILSRPAEKPERAELSPSQTAGIERAQHQLDVAISRHTLTRDDVLEMRAQLSAVGSTQETEALRARISTAINHGQIVPQDRLFIMP